MLRKTIGTDPIQYAKTDGENMMSYLGTSMAGTVCGLLLAGMAMAEDAGKREYMDNCASCHGESAMGQGPLAELMTVDVPSLTTLSANNDGVFPMLDVIQTIDGRQGTRGHGYPMPVWGSRFAESMQNTGPYGSEVIVRGRILSLAYYLESIQE